MAGALRTSVGMLIRGLRRVQGEGGLTLPESSALMKLERGGSATPSALARLEQISPQSMGATLAGLEERGLIERRADPADGRRALMSLTEAGRAALADRRDSRTGRLARALAAGFTPAEVQQLMAVTPLLERLAESV